MNLTLWIFRRSYRQSLTDNRNQFQKIFSVQVIKQQQVHQGQETEYFQDQETAFEILGIIHVAAHLVQDQQKRGAQAHFLKTAGYHSVDCSARSI